MGWLALVRHGNSEWNKLGKWTGWTDVDLTAEGKEEARQAGVALCDLPIDEVHLSKLKRTHQTFAEMAKEMKCDVLPNIDSALNERDYGVYTGKNKWEIKEEVGDEQFNKLRRGWDTPIPEGESLAEVYKRVVPYYKQYILPALKEGKNVLIVAHGNTLRALVKYLESLDEEAIEQVEVGTGEVRCYRIDENSTVCEKKIMTA